MSWSEDRPAKGKMVFVVDDEPLLSETIAEVVRTQLCPAMAFEDPRQVLVAVERIAPTILICDYAMPHLDGLTLAQRLLEKVPECKVLLFTTALEMSLASCPPGGFEFLEKPSPPRELLEKLRQMLSEPEFQRPAA